MANIQDIANLLNKYLKDELSADEKLRLDEWISQSAHNRLLFEEMADDDQLNRDITEYYKTYLESAQDPPSIKKSNVIGIFKKNAWYRYVAAASVLLILASGAFLLFTNRTSNQAASPLAAIASPTEILPAGNKATLTLANGNRIVLDSAGNGTIAQEGKTIISKKKDGQLEYHVTGTEQSLLNYNTVSTPRGGKYELMLPDGSKVWLNAASSIRFPVAFTGNERMVELNGEAYFEVAPAISNSGGRRPFIVKKGNMEVTVLGTHFNVNSYDEEKDIKVTLLEGAVKVTQHSYAAGGKQDERFIKPGQQAIMNEKSNSINVINKTDAESAIAWIRGRFSFERTDFGAIMRDLTRWYDVQVVYEGNAPVKTYSGEVDRTIPLSELLATLEKMGSTHFRLEGRTVRVIP